MNADASSNSIAYDTDSDSSGLLEIIPANNLTESLGHIYRHAVQHSTSAVEHIVWCTLLYTALCLIGYRLLFQKWAQRYRQPVRLPQCKRVLVVTAHPDDECMFFGPTIVALSQRDECHVYLLCLSNGK